MAYLDHYTTKRNEGLSRKHKGQTRQLLKGEKRTHVVNTVIDTLRDWRSSPFEHEAACRAGLRAGLCMEGYRWAVSDIEAHSIINEALRVIGAVRPTWDEGQRFYTVPKENCKWCGNHIPEDERNFGKDPKFCSTVCAKSARVSLSEQGGAYSTGLFNSAYRLVRKKELSEKYPDGRNCRLCGDKFIPTKAERGKLSEYCSTVCYEKSKKLYPVRSCANCNHSFQPYHATQFLCSDSCARGRVYSRRCKECGCDYETKSQKSLFCMNACSLKHRRRKRLASEGKELIHIGTPIACEHCGTLFLKKTSGSKYCSSNCRGVSQVHRLPSPNIIYFTPAVFDSWFARAA